MPSRNRPAKDCEPASFAPNDTGAVSWANLSDMNFPTRTQLGTMLPVAGRPVQDGIMAFGFENCCNPCATAMSPNDTSGHRAALKPVAVKKGAAVAGGSKVITGRRQTEWTGATRRPEAGRCE